MVRFLVLSLSLMLTAQAAPAFGQVTSITVKETFSNGNIVSAVCSVGKNDQVSGTGIYSGTNPRNGYKWKYPFTINKFSSASGKIILTGTLDGVGYPVTLTASVPNGPASFAYAVKGVTYSYSGTGTVTLK